MSEETKIVISKESLWQSIVSDTYTSISLIAPIGIGVLLDSSAMQWAGFIMFWLWVVVRVSRGGNRFNDAKSAIEYLKSMDNK